MSDSPKRPWYSPRLRWIFWTVLAIVAILALDLVRDFYLNDDSLFPGKGSG